GCVGPPLRSPGGSPPRVPRSPAASCPHARIDDRPEPESLRLALGRSSSLRTRSEASTGRHKRSVSLDSASRPLLLFVTSWAGNNRERKREQWQCQRPRLWGRVDRRGGLEHAQKRAVNASARLCRTPRLPRNYGRCEGPRSLLHRPFLPPPLPPPPPQGAAR